MKGYAPGWQVRCTKCGLSRAAADVGIVRFAARSRMKSILGTCPGCSRPRFLTLEKEAQGVHKAPKLMADGLD